MAIPLLPFVLGAAAVQTIGGLMGTRAQVGALTGQAAAREADAAATEVATAWAVRRSREQGDRALGEIRARIAASGLPIAGSPLEVLAESARQAELDVQGIQLEGGVRARTLRREAGMLRGQARRAGYGGALSALTSVTGGLANYGLAGGFNPSAGGSITGTNLGGM